MVLNGRLGYLGELTGNRDHPPCPQIWASSPEKPLKAVKILFYLFWVKVNFTQQQGSDRRASSGSKREFANTEIKEGTGPWRPLVDLKQDLVTRQHTGLSNLIPGVKFQNVQHAAVCCYTYLDGQSRWSLSQMSAFRSHRNPY